MYFIAQELREIMAKLGFRKIDEMVGRVDRLKQKENIHSWKAKNVDLSSVLYTPEKYKGKVIKFDSHKKYDFKLEKVLDEINPQLEYKFRISTDKPYIICSIKQLGLSKKITFYDMKIIMDQKNCNEKEAILQLLQSILDKNNA